MNKRKICVIVLLLIIALISILIIGKSCSKDNIIDKANTNFDEMYEENDNSIMYTTRIPKTELKKKMLQVNAFQKCEIIIDTYVEEGNLDVEVYDVEKQKLIKINHEDNSNIKIINIREGLGEYKIEIDAKNFVGKCNITWTIKDYDNTELFTSTMGYELRYDPNKFQVEYSDSEEKFVYKDANEQIFMKVYIVEASNVVNTKNEINGAANQTGICQIDSSNMNGTYALRKTADNQDKNIENKKMMFDLNDKRMLVIEINEYADTEKILLANAHITNMIKTFKYDK